MVLTLHMEMCHANGNMASLVLTFLHMIYLKFLDEVWQDTNKSVS